MLVLYTIHVQRITGNWGVLGVNEDVCIGLIQHSITDELLSNRDGLIHGHTKIRQVVQKSIEAKKM